MSGTAWDASAVSKERLRLSTSAVYRFNVPVTAVDVVAGLRTAGTNNNLPSSIQYGFRFERGLFTPVVNGVRVGSTTAYASSDTFIIGVVDNTIVWYRNDFNTQILAETNYSPSSDYELAAALYSVGDSVDDARYTPVTTNTEGDIFIPPEEEGSSGGTGVSEGSFTLVGTSSEAAHGTVFGSFTLTGSAGGFRNGATGQFTLQGNGGTTTIGVGSGAAYGEFALEGEASGGFLEAGVSFAVGGFSLQGESIGRTSHRAEGTFTLVGFTGDGTTGSAEGNFVLEGAAYGEPVAVNSLTLNLTPITLTTGSIDDNVVYILEKTSAATVGAFINALLIRDGVRATDTPQTMQTIAVSVTDVCNAILTAQPQFLLSLLEQVEVTDTVTFTQALSILESARAIDATAVLRAASLILGLTARDLLSRAISESLYESLDADTEAQLQLRRVAEVLDEVEAALTVSGTFVLAVNDTLSAEAGDSIETLAHYFSNITEYAESWVGFKLGDEQYTGVVMNTDSDMPISTYDGYGFNSFAEVDGHYYGANDEGVFLLEGATDAGQPISASLSTMMLDFGSARQKRVQTAYIGYTASGALVLRVRSVTDGVLNEQWYDVKLLQADAPREQMVRFGRGARSRYWQFELVNVDGADFELDVLELHPIYLNRRV